MSTKPNAGNTAAPGAATNDNANDQAAAAPAAPDQGADSTKAPLTEKAPEEKPKEKKGSAKERSAEDLLKENEALRVEMRKLAKQNAALEKSSEKTLGSHEGKSYWIRGGARIDSVNYTKEQIAEDPKLMEHLISKKSSIAQAIN